MRGSINISQWCPVVTHVASTTRTLQPAATMLTGRSAHSTALLNPGLWILPKSLCHLMSSFHPAYSVSCIIPIPITTTHLKLLNMTHKFPWPDPWALSSLLLCCTLCSLRADWASLGPGLSQVHRSAAALLPLPGAYSPPLLASNHGSHFSWKLLSLKKDKLSCFCYLPLQHQILLNNLYTANYLPNDYNY